MKKLLAIGATCALVSMSAAAQAQSYNWSGVYAGVHAGYGKATERADDVPPGFGYFTGALGRGFTFDQKGFVGGGQLGVQHQWSNLVLGAELSLTGGKLSKTIASPYFPASDTETGKIGSTLMATARLGWAVNNWLLYAKGGYASAEVEFNAYDRLFNVSYGQSKRQAGYVIGAGVEYGLTQNITLGLEYLHTDLSAKTTEGRRSTGGLERYRTDAEIDTFTVRLNYLMGRSAAAPAPLK